jgi:CubicO group peptidase (beta-lactamase class C family)
MRYPVLFAIPALLLFAWPCHGESGRAIPDDLKQSIRARVDGGRNMGIVLGVIDEEGTRYFGYGRISGSSARTPDENTVFEVGSVTKVFTALLLADMAGKNEVALNDPIRQYLPASVTVPRRKGRSIALVHLASHTSGLPRLPVDATSVKIEDPFADCTVDDMYEFISGYALPRDIGKHYQYSNLGAGLLGHILALRGGRTYEDLLKTRVFDVIGLPDTRVTPTPGMDLRLAKGYHEGFETQHLDVRALEGAVALRSTARDLLRFLGASIGLVGTPLCDAMRVTHTPRFQRGDGEMQVALGWHIHGRGERSILWHDGATGGFRSFIAFDPESRKGVVVLTNSARSVNDLGFHILDPSSPLLETKPSVAAKIRQRIAEAGIQAGIQLYRDLREHAPGKYNFRESELNTLGHKYLLVGRIRAAISIFKLNVDAYPNAPGTYASLGEGYLARGDTTLAVVNTMKSLALHPRNHNAVEMLERVGVDLGGRPED